MKFKKGFRIVGDKLITDEAIQIVCMGGTAIFLLLPLLWIINIIEDHYSTTDAFMVFLLGVGVIGLAVWGAYEVTEAGKESD